LINEADKKDCQSSVDNSLSYDPHYSPGAVYLVSFYNKTGCAQNSRQTGGQIWRSINPGQYVFNFQAGLIQH